MPALTEYFGLISDGLEKFRIPPTPQNDFPERVVQNITDFRPYRNELITVFSTISLYKADLDSINRIHRFFESIIHYMHKPSNMNSWYDTDFDNFRFIIWELFLYCIAALLRHERFQAIAALLEQEYYFHADGTWGEEVMRSFAVFGSHIKAIYAWNQKQPQRWLSPCATLLKDSNHGTNIGFDKLMTADFTLFMRTSIRNPNDRGWFPHTLVYVGRFARAAFEVFARAKSLAYFEDMKAVLGVKDKNELATFVSTMEKDPRGTIPRWEFESFSPRALLGLDKIATSP
jgi:hypothetical protein